MLKLKLPQSSLMQMIGLKLQQISSGASCLILAISKAIDVDEKLLRDEMSRYMTDHRQTVMTLYESTTSQFKHIINRIKNGSESGNHVEIEVIQKMLNRPMIILTESGAIEIFGEANPNCFPAPIFLRKSGLNNPHYDAYTLEEHYTENQILEQIISLVTKENHTTSTSKPNLIIEFIDFLDRLQNGIKKTNVFGLGQNSILFSTLEMLALEPLMQGRLLINTENKPILIINKYWLDHVHESRLETSWGQLPREYPFYFHQKIIDIIPGYSEDRRLTFREFKMLRNSIFKDLRAMGVQIFSGLITTVIPEERNGQKVVNITLNTGAKVQIAQGSEVINTLTNPNPNTIKDANDEDLPDQSKLYEFAYKHAPKNLILFGFGLSSVWIREQCPESEIRYLVSDVDRAKQTLNNLTNRNSHTSIQAHQFIGRLGVTIVPLERLFHLRNAQPEKIALLAYLSDNAIKLDTLKPHLNDLVIFEETNQVIGKVLFIGRAYSAIGYGPATYRMDAINLTNIYPNPAENLRVSAPGNLPSGALMDRYTAQIVEFGKHQSIGQRALLIPIETLSFQPEHLTCLKDYLYQCNIDLDDSFFTLLKTEVKKLDDTPKEPLAVLKKAYKTTHPLADYEKFNKVLDELLLNRWKMFKETQSPPITTQINAMFQKRNQASPDNTLANPIDREHYGGWRPKKI